MLRYSLRVAVTMGLLAAVTVAMAGMEYVDQLTGTF